MAKIKALKAVFTLAELKAAETISQGHTDNLKFDNKVNRVWLSRMTVGDGMPYDNQVTIEQYDPKSGRWETVQEYEAK